MPTEPGVVYLCDESRAALVKVTLDHLAADGREVDQFLEEIRLRFPPGDALLAEFERQVAQRREQSA